MRDLGLLAILSLFAARAAAADSLTVDFKSLTLLDATQSNGIWDIANGRISAAVAPLSPTGTSLDFGDASDGDFANDQGIPYPRSGLTIAGTTLTADTDTRAEYKLTSFNLAAGYTLQARGSRPLLLHVYGPVTIAGTLDVSGQNGNGNGTAGGGNKTIGAIPGGTPGAGGGAGGGAGQVDVAGAGTAGSSGASGSTASHGGTVGGNQGAANNDRGGGGGCDGAGATSGTGGAAAGVCSAAATIGGAFDDGAGGGVFGGGAGGGGGGACTLGCNNGTAAQAVGGSAGGGGGGAIRIIAAQAIRVTGTLRANGGTGGANDADGGGVIDCGGGGGGGAGGAIWLQSAAGVLNPGGGAIQLNGGAGGDTLNPNCASVYPGGSGSAGVLRVDALSNAFGGAQVSQSTGVVTGATSTVTSKIMNLPNAAYEFDAATESAACGSDGTLAVTYQGSHDGATFSDAVPATQITRLNGYPYLRFKAAITATGPNPPCLNGLAFQYHLTRLTDYSLRGGLIFCGATRANRPRRGPPAPGEPPLFVLMLGNLGVLALAAIAARRLAYGGRGH